MSVFENSKEKAIKTSIIVPVYNTGEYVKECLQSIFLQTQKEIEVIAINDGSTDNSLEILTSLQHEYPELVVVSQKNHGLGYTRNVGIDMANGEYIYFIDSDDCLDAHAMETCYQYAKLYNLEAVMFDAEIIGDELNTGKNIYDRKDIIKEKKKVISGEEFLQLYYKKSFCPSACLVYLSRKFLLDINIRFLPRVYYEDNLFHCQIMAYAKRIMYISELLYRRRYRRNSIMMSAFDARKAKDLLVIIQKMWEIDNLQIQNETRFIANKFFKSLIIKCKENRLLEDRELVELICRCTVCMYGENVCLTKSFQNIDTVCSIYSEMPNTIVSEIKVNEVCKRRKDLFCKSFFSVPLNIENKKVGIYGMGQYSRRFLEDYENCFGEIKAEMIFIDSFQKSLEKRERGCLVYNVKDIGEIPLNCIVIASDRYEEAMYCKIKELYGEKFQIICLYKDLSY